MATHSLPKTASAKPQKPQALNDEASKIVALSYQSLGRFAKMMAALDQFCMHVETDGPEHDFAFAVASLADMIKRDAENIRERLGQIIIGANPE